LVSVADFFFRLTSEVGIIVSELIPPDVAGQDATLARMSICSTLTGRCSIAATINGWKLELASCLYTGRRCRHDDTRYVLDLITIMDIQEEVS
jgi:hypothetical protein